MHYSAKPYNTVTNVADLVHHDGVATGIDHDDMAEETMRMVMQDDIGQLILNYDFERSKLNSILDDHQSFGIATPHYYEFWNNSTLNDILVNVSDDEQIAAAAARTLYCLADFTQDAVMCHYQTLTDAFGFNHNFDFWNSWGVPLAPYYQPPRRIGPNVYLTGKAYYDWIINYGYNDVEEVDGDSYFSVTNHGNYKQFSCKDETLWQSGWERCVGPVMAGVTFNAGWSAFIYDDNNDDNWRRKVSFTKNLPSPQLDLDMEHRKSSSTPAKMWLMGAQLTGPYNWGWSTLTPANHLLEAIQ
jgi:hypothetical protein